MATRYISSRLIQSIEKGGKMVIVEYVDKTTTWIRPTGSPATSVQTEFVQVVTDNFETLQPTTAFVAMKESEHKSDLDKRKHYTAYELNSDRTVTRTTHFVRQIPQ
ncbi:uncharacterized protein BO97DRAFT_447415 [Aspergillus homomorphus CBS 101889]|uniref:Uncharacterized protein n=1 Tax=Aspergillus homomorphus (strain CBS 101889) TaxID=1450537 RepID=A0A395HFX6_ASPHC|nr:hypothetical protein BO97DRAFT_447415 [Aspergillus homomorphus CBS 101889]RAL06640.1 hypothetical protein BO97DRAFT_447415 [Aspergillus homomorphus CBS 101889]